MSKVIEFIKNPKWEIIDRILMCLYAYMLIFQFKRYVFDGAVKPFLLVLLLVRVSLMAIGIYKLIYYRSDRFYLLLSICLICFSFVYYCFKFEQQYNMFFSQHTQWLDVVLIIVSMYRVNAESFIKIFAILIGTLLVIRVICAQVGILNNEIVDIKGKLAYNFGFGSHNNVFKYWVFVVVSWLFLIRNKKRKWISVALIIGFTIYMYVYTISRTGTIIILSGTIGFVIVSVLEKLYREKNIGIAASLLRVFRVVMLLMPAMFVIVSVGGTIMFNYGIYSNGDPGTYSTFEQRFHMFSMDAAYHGIKLPWQYMSPDEVGTAPYSWILGGKTVTRYCDNVVHNVLINDGLIWLVLLVAYMQWWTVKAYREKNNVLLLAIGMICIYSTMETSVQFYGWNPFLILLFANMGDCVENGKGFTVDNYGRNQ